MDSLAERKDVASIKGDNLGHGGDKPDWISFKGTVTFLKKDKEGGAWYTACPNDKEPCKNRYKVAQTTDGQWHCEKCQGTYATCVRRWIFSGTVADDTSSTWVSFFNEQAEVLLNATADQVYATTSADMGGGDQDQYDSYFSQATNTEWIFKCKVKNEMMGDEQRVKTSVYSLLPVDYVKESRDLLAALAKF
jgi:replication factor A1